MSQMRAARRVGQNDNSAQFSFDVSELSRALTPMLSPILNQLSVLTETVASVVNTLNRRDGQDYEKKNDYSEYAAASITADVSMMASDTRRLSKNYESLKEQWAVNQHHVTAINEKLESIERLLTTFVKRQTRKKSPYDTKVTEVLQNFEDYLITHSLRNKAATMALTRRERSNTVEVALDPETRQLVTLNCEEDFPHGSWLGDYTVPKLRVRCPIRQEDLIFINTKCSTPEKMALTLLDYLFTKETLATSNLSGKSKLGKRQLDPLMIYGIKCHLIHHFNTTEKQWDRIRQNIDSKCRSAWKKRRLSQFCISYETDESCPDFLLAQESEGAVGGVSVAADLERMKPRLFRKVQGDIEVLHARADQVLRFQDLHNVHVLDGDHILPIISSDGEDVENGISLSKSSEQSDLAIIAEGTDMDSADTVSFVMEPMLEVLTEGNPLTAESVELIEEREVE